MPSVLADRVQLQQVVLNLVVKGVSDRGTGLAPDEMDRVFQAFYTTKAERNPDRGATFTFRLPAAPRAAS